MRTLEFDYKKATQALNFFAKRAGGKITKLNVLKLIYLADRFHLRKYGRPIFSDAYWAMPLGPVASSVKDLLEFSGSDEELNYSTEYIAPLVGEPNPTIQSIKEEDVNVFSDSDIEALEFVQNNFGVLNLGEILKVCHNYPEWKKFEEALKSKTISRELMSYVDFFENSDSLEDVFKMDPEQLKASKEIFEEQSKISGQWN
jgi:uncharacterized phage-associated protein